MTITNFDFHEIAKMLRSHGFKVVPVDCNKHPLVKWRGLITDEQLDEALTKACGLAIAGGPINDREAVVILDVDDVDEGFKILRQVFGEDWPSKLCGRDDSFCGLTGPRPKGSWKCTCGPGDCDCTNIKTGEVRRLSELKRGMYVIVRVPIGCAPKSTVRSKAIELQYNNYEVVFGKHPSGVWYEPARYVDGLWVKTTITNVGGGVTLSCDQFKALLELLKGSGAGEEAGGEPEPRPKAGGRVRYLTLDDSTILKIAGHLINGYKKGQRQDYALAIAGMMARMRVDPVSVAKILKALHDNTNDEEPLKLRLSTITYTYAKMGLPVDLDAIKAAVGEEPYHPGELKLSDELTGAGRVKELLAGVIGEDEARKAVNEVKRIIRREWVKHSVIARIRHAAKRGAQLSEIAYLIAKAALKKFKHLRYITYNGLDLNDLRCWDGRYFRRCEADVKRLVMKIYETAGVHKFKLYNREYRLSTIEEEVFEILKAKALLNITDEDLRYIAFNNVIYDWKEGRLLPIEQAAPDMMIIHFIPHEINVEAFEEAVKAPAITEELVAKWAPNTLKAFKDWVGGNWLALFEVIGSILYPKQIRRLFLLVDAEERGNYGDTGKSTYIRLVQKLIGLPNYSTVPLQDLLNPNNRFARWSIYLKLANFYADLPDIALENPGMLKVLTGDDVISVERKYRDPFEYRPICKHLFSANTPPPINLSRTDAAFWKRWVIIEFVGRFERPIADFENQLLNEAPSILAIALAAFLKAKERGFTFSVDPVNEDRAAHYERIWLSRLDPIYQFILWAFRNGILTPDSDARIPLVRVDKSHDGVRPLYYYFNIYREVRRIRPVPATVFSRHINELGLPVVNPRGYPHLKGFRINEEAFAHAISELRRRIPRGASIWPREIEEAIDKALGFAPEVNGGSGDGSSSPPENLGELAVGSSNLGADSAGAVKLGGGGSAGGDAKGNNTELSQGADAARQESEVEYRPNGGSGSQAEDGGVGEGAQGAMANMTCSIVDVGGTEGEAPYYGVVQLNLACALLNEFKRAGYDFLGMAGMLLNEYEHHHPVCDAEYLMRVGYLSMAAVELGVDVGGLAHRVVEALRGVGLCQ